MFKASQENPFNGPHQTSKTVTAGTPTDEADAAIVMVHGRGGAAENILGLANDLEIAGNVHLAAPQAQGFTWYPYSFLEPTERNEPGLSSGLQAIFDIMTGLAEKGIPKEKIIFMGFSQGACLASEFVARHPAKYGGLIAFSGGLIGDTVDAEHYSGTLNGTPYFIGCSDVDPHIPVERVHASAAVMEKLGALLNKKIYPGMPHTIIQDEISEASNLIKTVTAT